MNENILPDWLFTRLNTFSLDWSKSTVISFNQLLEIITFHDSYWYRILIQNGNSLILIFELDAIWNKDFCYNHEDWPFLIIEFQNVTSIVQYFYPEDGIVCTISDSESISIAHDIYFEWLEQAKAIGIYDTIKPINKPIYNTKIDTIYGGLFSFVHQGNVRVLLYSAEEELLKIKFL